MSKSACTLPQIPFSRGFFKNKKGHLHATLIVEFSDKNFITRLRIIAKLLSTMDFLFHA